MSNLYISEYERMPTAIPGPGGTQIALEPRVAAQKVSFTGTPGLSAAFGSTTKLIQVHTDGICSYLVGAAPTAAVTDMRMPADATMFIAVGPGQKISAITNT